MNRTARRREIELARAKAPGRRRAHARRREGSPSGTTSLTRSWQDQPLSLRILRAFLGVTFVYAGIQKFADPNFFRAGGADFIGMQLRDFAKGSPIAGILHFLDRAPILTGAGIALTEIAVGMATLVGVAPILFAVGGLLINVALTLSATWHVHPYFLGSDSMYAVGWLAYLIGLVEMERRRRGGRPLNTPAEALESMGRREFLRGGALAALTLFAGSAAKALAGPAAAAGSATSALGAGSGASAASASGSAGAVSAQGTTIASLDQIGVGQAIGFNAPGEGPAVLVRLAQDRVVAYSRTCTHAGCLVGYDPSQRILFCPCHGAEFDPARGAAPIAGPAPTPLPPIDVAVDRSTGAVVLPS